MKTLIKMKEQIFLFVLGLLFFSFTHSSLASTPSSPPNNIDEQQATQVAEAALFLGESLNNQTTTSDMTSYFRSQALNKMNGEIEGWLKQFGNARARMELDEKFTLKNY